MRAHLLVASSCAALVIASPAHAEQATTLVDFQTSGQSLWVPGTAAEHIVHRLELGDLSWNAGGSAGDIVTLDDLVGSGLSDLADELGISEDSEFGAELSASTSGRVHLYIDLADGERSSVDARLPASVVLSFPNPNTFGAGDVIYVESAWSTRPGAYLNSSTPGAEVRFMADVAFGMSASARVCVFDCLNPSLSLPSIAPTTYEIYALKNTEDDGPVLDYVFGNFPLPHTFEVAETLATGLYGTVALPATATASSQQASGLLVAQGSNHFVDVGLDLDGYVPVFPPLGFTTTDLGDWQFTYHALDVDNLTDLTEHRRLELAPRIEVTVDLGQAMAWAIHRAGSFVTSGHGQIVTFLAGDTLELAFPTTQKHPVSVPTAFDLDNTFSHRTWHDFENQITLMAGYLRIEVPGFEIFGGGCIGVEIEGECIGVDLPRIAFPGVDVALGPFYQTTLHTFQDDFTFFSDSWELQGFPTHVGAPFVLDPENPSVAILKETANVVNNGGGTRTVTYAILVDNTGDVPLDDLQVVDALAQTFPQSWAAYAVDFVQSCELHTNAGYDGAADTQLLTGEDVLDDGWDPNPPPVAPHTEGLIVVRATVAPEPFPPFFTNTATTSSESWYRRTPISGSATSEVDLGPSQVDALDDFALYAEHMVALKDTAFIRGHVGSGRFIEVQQGDAGTVAGDLRALETIGVHGAIVVDYAFTDEEVNVTGQGELTATGGVVEHDAQAAFAVTPTLSGVGCDARTGDALEVEPGASETLWPGAYASITVGEGATLVLAGHGGYCIARLTLEAGATLFVDTASGAVTLDVTIDLAIAAGARIEVPDAPGATRLLHINALQQGNILIGEGALVSGILTAPNAEITFRDQIRLRGAAYARFLSLERGVRVDYHDDWSGTLWPRIDLDCDGLPDR